MKLSSGNYFYFCLPAVILILSSCKTIIQEPLFVNFENPPDYTVTLREFRESWPLKLSMDQSAIIKIGPKKVATLGLCSFNAENGDISLVLMTTTGMKLIEIEKKAENSKIRFAIPELSDNQNAGKQLIEDVKIIYCHPKTSPDYCELRKNSLTYGWVASKNRTELIFGKNGKEQKIKLLIKKVFFDNSLVSIVYYSNYKLINGGELPMTTGYKNKKFGYSLVLTTTKIFFND